MKQGIGFVFLILSLLCQGASLNAESCVPKNSPDTFPEHTFTRVLLVVAMEDEAAPIIKTLGLKESPDAFPKLPMKGYAGKYANLDIFLIINGEDPVYDVQNVGTQASTLTTYLGIEFFHPDLVISVGTAGGISEKGAHINDIYTSTKIYFHARRIPIPCYAEYGLGGYSSKIFDYIIQKMNLKRGNICSSDSFDTTKIDRDIILKNGCAVIDMESAGVAWVSMLMKIPMLAIKGITDTDGNKNNTEVFQKNFVSVTSKLAESVAEFLQYLKKD